MLVYHINIISGAQNIIIVYRLNSIIIPNSAKPSVFCKRGTKKKTSSAAKGTDLTRTNERKRKKIKAFEKSSTQNTTTYRKKKIKKIKNCDLLLIYTRK